MLFLFVTRVPLLKKKKAIMQALLKALGSRGDICLVSGRTFLPVTAMETLEMCLFPVLVVLFFLNSN